MSNIKKLYRSKKDRIIFGVCGGMGEYFEVDSLIIRFLFILLSFTGGAGVIIYILLAIIMPKEGGAEARKSEKKLEEMIGETQEKTQEFAKELKRKEWRSGARDIIGLIIVLIGLNVLFEQVFKFSPLSWINWGVIWAVILILIGLRLASK